MVVANLASFRRRLGGGVGGVGLGEEGQGSLEKHPELPWKRGPATVLAAERSRVKLTRRDYWCSPALRIAMPTWPSSSGSGHRCIPLTNLSWCCPEVAVSVCGWRSPRGAVRLVSSCLLSAISASSLTTGQTPEPLPGETAEPNSKCLKPCTNSSKIFPAILPPQNDRWYLCYI